MVKKIALCVIASNFGGAESVVREIAANFHGDECELYLITNQELMTGFSGVVPLERIFNLGPLFSRRIIPRVINRLGGMLGVGEVLFRRGVQKKLSGAIQFIQSKGIELIHSHLSRDLHFACRLKKEIPSLKLLYTMHGYLLLGANSPKKNWQTKEELLQCLKQVDSFTSACDYFIGLLDSHDVKAPKYKINNGISREQVESYIKKRDEDKVFRFVYLGGERLVKGWDILLDAFSIIEKQKQRREVKLRVLREIPEQSLFWQKVKQHGLREYIEYVGYVNSPGHLKHMAESDVFLLPSRTEGIANTLMEAIGLELPVVATRVGGTPELIKHEKNGLLCDFDSEELASCMQRIMNEPELIDVFKSCCRQRKTEYFWEDVVNGYKEVYLSLLE